jgi:hypothetical protein
MVGFVVPTNRGVKFGCARLISLSSPKTVWTSSPLSVDYVHSEVCLSAKGRQRIRPNRIRSNQFEPIVSKRHLFPDPAQRIGVNLSP